MSKIKHIRAREILNAKGIPTVETTVVLSDNNWATASCPGRTLISIAEAAELYDNDSARFAGKGVLRAVDNVNSILAPKLQGMEAEKQSELDKIMIEMDGTQNKSRLGANALLSVSMAIAKSAARASSLPLFLYLRQFINKESLTLKMPTPCFNVLNGGKIAGGNLDFQSFILIPASAKTYSECLLIGSDIYRTLKMNLEYKNLPTLVGDEGGFGPSLPNNEQALELINQALGSTTLKLGFDVFLGLDCAANNFYSDKKYKIKDNVMQLSANEIINYYSELNKKYHVLYIEDPLQEEDWNSWVEISKTLSENTIIVGDHLTSTNPYRLQMAIDKKAITGIVIKPSQIGTVIESLAVVEVARQAGLKIIVSSTSAETNDDFIADFAVAVSADYVKFGAPARGENVSKYNRLSEIDIQLKTI
jgi:enolase